MGSFKGHVLPGTFFLLLSAWWYFGVLTRNIVKHRRRTDDRRLLDVEDARSGRRKRRRSQSNHRSWYGCTVNSTLAKLPLEPITKVALAILGIFLELFPDGEYALVDEHGHFIEGNLNNYGHSTMYAFFALSGVIDLLTWYTRLPLPRGLGLLSLATAFAVEGMLFAFHLEGRPALDVRLHTMLYGIIFATAITICMELAWRGNVLFPVARAYLTALQGTWFYQIAFTLHGSKPWQNIPDNVAFLSIALAWHLLLVFVVFLASFAAFYRCCPNLARSCVQTEEEIDEAAMEEEAAELNYQEESIALNTL